ncbi:MAG: extracellular solute-binding protein [Treponema sp.]|jgi:putative aldouronate transport system substrate-binding protein|nr:extracellular solute-binding protein [Treponema sp.]
MKRRVLLFLVLACTAVLAFAGGRQETSGGGVAKVPMRYYMPGAPTPETDIAVRAINEALARDGVNIDYQPIYIPWDQWVDKINLMLSTGDEFELLHIMEDYIPTSTYASRNYLTPLSALIQKETPNLTGRFEQVLWDSATVKGEIYSVPAFWRDNSGDYEGDTVIRKDKFDQYNIPVPQNPAEVISALTTLQQRWAVEDGIKRYAYEHALNRPPMALHRTYDTWPFYTSLDGIFQVRQNGEANLYYETEEFRKDAEFMNTLYSRGLIHPDILNLPADTINANKQDGEFLLGFMTGPQFTYDLTSRGINGEILKYKMSFDKPMLMNLPLQNSNGIPITTKHPEAGLKFLDWMYSSQANQDLVLYGVQGRHWTPVGTDQRRHVKGPDGNNLYMLDIWMIEYVKYHRFDVDDHSPQEEKDNWLRNIYPDRTVISPVVGFNFDSTPVRVEYANVTAEYTASILPIKVGVIPYTGNLPAAQAKMKAAGSDVVIAEYRRQLTEHITAKKK